LQPFGALEDKEGRRSDAPKVDRMRVTELGEFQTMSATEVTARKVTVQLRKAEYRWQRKVFAERGRVCETCGSAGPVKVVRRVALLDLVRQHGILTRSEGLLCDALWVVADGTVLCRECRERWWG